MWSSVAKVLKKSVGTAKGKYEVDDLYPLIKNDELVLWIVVDTADDLKLQLLQPDSSCTHKPLRTMAMDWIGGTRMKEWLSMAQEMISRYAKDHSCKYLEGYGRKGWGSLAW